MKCPLYFLVIAATISLFRASDPVCIIGAGPTGLTASAKLQEKGVKTVIFEKNPEAGGKCQAYYQNGIFHPMGALFFFANETYRETLPIINQSGVTAIPFAYVTPTWAYYYGDGKVQQLPSATELSSTFLFKEERESYISIRYKNGVDGYTQSTASWLIENNFLHLFSLFIQNTIPYGYDDINEVPIIYMLQLMTPDITTFFAGQLVGYAIDFHQVWVRYAATLKDPIHYNVSIIKVDRRQHSPSVIKYIQEGRTKSQTCSKIIAAFPPILRALEDANLDLDDEEKAVFKPVGSTKYWASSVTMNIPPLTLFGGMLNKTSLGYVPFRPRPAAAPVGFFRLQNETQIASVWSWGKYRSNQTTAEARELLIETLSKLNKDPSDESAQSTPIVDDDVKVFRGWDYFARYDQKQLEEGYYARYNALQGHRNTYYASGFNSIENVEYAIRAGIDIVDSFFQ